MRILIVNEHRSQVGGVESYLATVLPALAASGHTIAFLYTHTTGQGEATLDESGAFQRTWCLAEMGMRQVLEDIEAWRPDVIYAHCVAPVDLEAALLARYPAILYAHAYLGTCISGRKCHSFPRFQPCSRELGPACLALYGIRRCGGMSPITAFLAWREQSTRKQLLRQYARVLVASDHMHAELLHNGVSTENLRKAPLPVQACDSASSRNNEQGRLLMMGRLTDLKGGAYLLEALSTAESLLKRRLLLRVVGTGAEEESLRRIAIKRGMQVEFHGWLGSTQRKQLLLDSDLLVVPSVWPEPFGLVGVEAGQFGIPAVAFDVGGIRDWLIPGESGELANGNPPTPAALGEAIARALHDPRHYARLSAGALRVSGDFRLAPHLRVLNDALETAAKYSTPFV